MSEPTARTVPPTARHWRIPAMILWVFLSLRVLRVWSVFASPYQVHFLRRYVWASLFPWRATEYQALYDTYYHAPPWRVLLWVILVDAALLVILYSLAWRRDYAKVLELRRGHQVSGPRLHRKVSAFQKAIQG